MSDTGRPFGPFELFEVVADSPLAAVYRARRTADGKAAKLFRLEGRFASDANYLKRFLHQAQAAAQVSHPNLVATIGSGEVGGQYYLATEATDGGTVGDLLRSAGPLPEAKAVEIVRDCARALQAAWDAAQLTHGGIGVEDIRLQRDGTVKLAGLALVQLDEGSRVGDIQALGDTLYQMLVNEPRLQPDQSASDLAGKRPDIGPFVGEVIDKMRSQASWNYASYGQLIEDLDAVIAQRQPLHAQVKLTLGAASVSSSVGNTEPTTPAHARLRRRAAFDWKPWLIRLVGLAVLAATAWLTWQYFNRSRLLPLPPAPATPPPPIALVPAEPPPAAPALPTFDNIADPAERGRALTKHLGVGRLQAGFGGMLSVLDDGQIRWSYAFRSNKELRDFYLPDGPHRLQDGALQLPRAQIAFKCLLLGDITLAVEGLMVEADPNAPLLALAVAWHQNAGSERTFGLTRTTAELCEIVAGKRVVLASAPFELKPGTPLRYLLTQRGKACVVKVRDGPMVMGTFSQPAEGTLRLVSDGCTSSYSVLEITGTAPAAKLSQITP
ncbi:MAG: protein kinase [Verrucomicrobiia bacterium]|jgi:hypothetical protein